MSTYSCITFLFWHMCIELSKTECIREKQKRRAKSNPLLKICAPTMIFTPNYTDFMDNIHVRVHVHQCKKLCSIQSTSIMVLCRYMCIRIAFDALRIANANEGKRRMGCYAMPLAMTSEGNVAKEQ